MKAKYYVRLSTWTGGCIDIGTLADFRKGTSKTICARRFKGIAGFLPSEKKVPITIKIEMAK